MVSLSASEFNVLFSTGLYRGAAEWRHKEVELAACLSRQTEVAGGDVRAVWVAAIHPAWPVDKETSGIRDTPSAGALATLCPRDGPGSPPG